MISQMIHLYFRLDGEDYAFRVWPAVPPIGSKVMMHPEDGPKVHEVQDVVWGVGKDDVNTLTRTGFPVLTCAVVLGPAI